MRTNQSRTSSEDSTESESGDDHDEEKGREEDETTSDGLVTYYTVLQVPENAKAIDSQYILYCPVKRAEGQYVKHTSDWYLQVIRIELDQAPTRTPSLLGLSKVSPDMGMGMGIG